MNNSNSQDYINGNNREFLENTCRDLKSQGINEEWKDFYKEYCSNDIGDTFTGFSKKSATHEASQVENFEDALKHFYRKIACKYADLNPLSPVDNKSQILSIFKEYYPSASVEQNEKLNKKYLGTMSLEFEHITDQAKYNWLIKNYEEKKLALSLDEKKQVLQDLMEAELFEHFLHIKFPGAKRFSIEGAESAMVIFESFLKHSASHGVEEINIGMAHRGRLNFLTKVCKESYGFIFGLFKGKNAFDENIGVSGDVKYHLGASCDRNGVHISLLPNPSHLETVNPVVMGLIRAKQDNGKKAVPFLIHGDAAFAGQGIIYECLAMGNLPGYDIRGVVHLIIDNQIGFTADSCETRCTSYSSDIAKMLDAPIFHVNGDDPESAAIIAKIVAEYKSEFDGDIVINLVCYRRYGHNEGDEPNFTQPAMYQKITNHKTSFALYSDQLIKGKILSKEEIEAKKTDFNNLLQLEIDNFKSKTTDDLLIDRWAGTKISFDDSKITYTDTGIKKDIIKQLSDYLTSFPEDIKPNDKIKNLLKKRASDLDSGANIDWGTGEMLGFASLLSEGVNIRIAGEDVVRGTFAHRHAAITDQVTNKKYFYYADIATNGAKFQVYNSLLSEYGAMGFEYGYSMFSPKNLVIWEGQFGDFANGAQIIIDQLLSAGEQKWLRMSNLVLMLPHGFEGQGPEHSSARLERFLQLAAQYNMRIINPTTPANLCHALRRQIIDEIKKPLIIMTPKSLLRNKLATSELSEFTGETHFQEIFGNKAISQNDEKLILCSGKIYYDIYEELAKKEITNICLIKIEQLYPFPLEQIAKIIEKFGKKEIIWCQEEPRNMGAYWFICQTLNDVLWDNQIKLKYIGRPNSASVANGSTYEHNKEQKKIIDECVV